MNVVGKLHKLRISVYFSSGGMSPPVANYYDVSESIFKNLRIGRSWY